MGATMQRAFLRTISALALTWACASPAPIAAQTPADDAANTRWQLDAMIHLQRMRVFPDSDSGAQPTPSVIPQRAMDADSSGVVSTYQPGGATLTSGNAFFQNLGTNGRTCFTCHQPQNGWTISAASARARFEASAGLEPLFRLVDGATCPSANVSTLEARRQAYSLLTDKGLIRIGIKLP